MQSFTSSRRSDRGYSSDIDSARRGNMRGRGRGGPLNTRGGGRFQGKFWIKEI